MASKSIEMTSLFLSELLATALLMFLGCMGCITWGKEYNHLQTVLSFGLIIMIIVQAFGCVSGAHLNPSVTIAAAVYNIVSVPLACIYIVAQLLGAFMGYGLLITLTPSHIIRPVNATGPGLCSTVPHPDVTPFQAVAVEYIATSVLILMCCAIWDPRNAKYQEGVPLKFGLAIAAIASVAGPFTGASMNPARSLGPALWNQDFHLHWIYWVGPLPAALVTAIVYKNVFRREVVEKHDCTCRHNLKEELLIEKNIVY